MALTIIRRRSLGSSPRPDPDAPSRATGASPIRPARDSRPLVDSRVEKPSRQSSSRLRKPREHEPEHVRERASRTPRPDALAREASASLRRDSFEHVAIDELIPDPENARKHSERQIEQLMTIIRKFGFIGVIAIDEDNNILAGHGRFEAARRLGLTHLPCDRVTHLSHRGKVAFAVADNRLAELSTWDDQNLSMKLAKLVFDDPEFDMEITGVDTVDYDRLLGAEPDPRGAKEPVEDYSTDPDDQIGALRDDRPAISQPGDLWILGSHRLFHGDASEPLSYEILLGRERVAQVVADPPYNVANRGHVSKKAFREFAMAHGEMSSPQFVRFLSRFMSLSAQRANKGAIFHVFMDWPHAQEVLTAAKEAGLEQKNLCVWIKPAAGMGSFYRSQHELVFVFKSAGGKAINNFGLGGGGRNRSNVWRPKLQPKVQTPIKEDGPRQNAER